MVSLSATASDESLSSLYCSVYVWLCLPKYTLGTFYTWELIISQAGKHCRSSEKLAETFGSWCLRLRRHRCSYHPCQSQSLVGQWCLIYRDGRSFERKKYWAIKTSSRRHGCRKLSHLLASQEQYHLSSISTSQHAKKQPIITFWIILHTSRQDQKHNVSQLICRNKKCWRWELYTASSFLRPPLWCDHVGLQFCQISTKPHSTVYIYALICYTVMTGGTCTLYE